MYDGGSSFFRGRPPPLKVRGLVIAICLAILFVYARSEWPRWWHPNAPAASAGQGPQVPQKLSQNDIEREHQCPHPEHCAISPD